LKKADPREAAILIPSTGTCVGWGVPDLFLRKYVRFYIIRRW
jgi:hypothetical protein